MLLRFLSLNATFQIVQKTVNKNKILIITWLKSAHRTLYLNYPFGEMVIIVPFCLTERFQNKLLFIISLHSEKGCPLDIQEENS